MRQVRMHVHSSVALACKPRIVAASLCHLWPAAVRVIDRLRMSVWTSRGQPWPLVSTCGQQLDKLHSALHGQPWSVRIGSTLTTKIDMFESRISLKLR